LESYLKSRSSSLDNEIASVKARLEKTAPSLIGNTPLLMKGQSLNPTIITEKEKVKLDLNSSKIEQQLKSNDSYNISPTKNNNHNIDNDTSKSNANEFLSKMKLRMADLSINAATLKEILLPKDLMLPGETSLPIHELTTIFQTDLAMSVSTAEQIILLKEYGAENGYVNVKKLFKEANIWNEDIDPYASVTRTSAQAEGARRRIHQQEEIALEKEKSLATSTDSEMYADLITRSTKEIDALSDMHKILLAENELDNSFRSMESSPSPKPNPIPNPYTNSSSNIEKASNLLERGTVLNKEKDDDVLMQSLKKSSYSTESERDAVAARLEARAAAIKEAEKIEANIQFEQQNKIKDQVSSDLKLIVSNNSPPQPKYMTEIKYEEKKEFRNDENRVTNIDNNIANKLALLEKENARLKAEMSVFDRDFFEEVEDLKYRYTKLKEVVGDVEVESSSGKTLPLERLSWSLRKSMTAIDKISHSNPRSNPMNVSPYTYAPGNNPYPDIRKNNRIVANSDIRTIGESTSLSRTNRGQHERGGTIGYGDISRSVDRDLGLQDSYRMQTKKGIDMLDHNSGGQLLKHKNAPIRVGGTHGIGAGSHSADGLGTFSDLCERRLAFELQCHPNPSQAAKNMVHKLMDNCKREGDNYISIAKLHDIISSVGLRMARAEVEILASGFGSDGRGSINVPELCETVHTLVYDILGQKEAEETKYQSMDAEATHAKVQQDEVDKLILEICENILAYDKKAILGSAPSMYKALIEPFKDVDVYDKKVLGLGQFISVCKDLGIMLTYKELTFIAKRYAAKGMPADSALSSSNLDHIDSFKGRVLEGSLKGVANNNAKFGEWLSSSGLPLNDPTDENIFVEYEGFVGSLVDCLESLMEKKGGLIVTSSAPWTLKEFELVDILICQLEDMKPSDRRRCLMALSYSLSLADSRQEGEVDGFALLNAILGSGFKLQRLNRVRLLRSIEEMGGKIEYNDLCLVLLRSCADWTTEEKVVVKKILSAMGSTVLERRTWFSRIRQLFTYAASEYQKKVLGNPNRGNPNRLSTGEGNDISNPGIPPAAFLHCLRESGVSLEVEEEATLLDCLDTERLSELGSASDSYGSGSKHKNKASSTTDVGLPLTYYKSFLNFANRFCGDWTDSSPDVYNSLKESLRTISDTTSALHEFFTLVHSFDELNSGHISTRAFQIACHRARLLGNMPEDDVKTLTEVLAIEGGGKIVYTPFLVHLRVLCSDLQVDSTAPSIIEQLIANSIDPQGCLFPLRNWIMRHIERDDMDMENPNPIMETYRLTRRDLNNLLREFSVVYRPQDLDHLLLTIQNFNNKNDKVGNTDKRIGMAATKTSDTILASDLISLVLRSRPSWTEVHLELGEKMKKLMFISGQNTLITGVASNTLPNQGIGSKSNKGSMQASYSQGSKGVEGSIARRILSRLRAFVDLRPASEGVGARMVEIDIFSYIIRATGLPLNDEEILILADSTDPNPKPNMIRCDVITEALTLTFAAEPNTDTNKKGELKESSSFALQHLRELLWRTATQLKRSNSEWIADVNAVFRGFDTGSTGFIASEDFILGLALVNVILSLDIIKDLPGFPDGPGLVPYTKILDLVLIPPEKKGQTKKIDIGKLSKKQNEKTDIPGKSTSINTYANENKNSNVDANITGSGIDIADKNKSKNINTNKTIKTILSVVRRSIRKFIVTGESLEDAWIHLLKSFKRFDPLEKNVVTSRDFCLAVSVLIEGDLVLTKEEWLDVISFFSVKNKTAASAAGLQVDYMFFIESVLDPQGLQDSMLESWKDNKEKDNKKETTSLTTQGQLSRKNNENIIRGKLYEDPSKGGRLAGGGGSTSKMDQAQFTPEQSRLLDKFRRELEDLCEKQTRNSKFKTIKDFLATRLMDEDKNGSGALTKQSLFACLNQIGINPQIYFGNNSKEIFEQIMDKTGKILINDFLKLSLK